MRTMIWLQSPSRESWGCSECVWSFHPSGPPLGDSLDEMKRNYERQRDREFAGHVCAQHPRPKASGSQHPGGRSQQG
jgi:hypothetical protein